MKIRNMAALIAALAIAFSAAAQENNQNENQELPEVNEEQRQQLSEQMEGLRQLMTQANVDEETSLLAIYVFGAIVMPFAPAHVLAARQELDLTDNQVEQLRELERETQQKAREILNEEQRARIGEIEPIPVLNAARQALPLLMPRPPVQPSPPPHMENNTAPPETPPAAAQREF